MVRLLLDLFAGRFAQLLVFQSHNGAIAAVLAIYFCGSLCFVSIPQWCDCCWQKRQDIKDGKVFQSHNGAIAAKLLILTQFFGIVFQSHNGAIAACG